MEKQPAPRQRLTGFESLEPRMVLSGAAPFMVNDYLSPLPEELRQIARSGAEYSGLAGEKELGRLSDFRASFPSGEFGEPRIVRVDRVDGLVGEGKLRDVMSRDLLDVQSEGMFSNSFAMSTLSGLSDFASDSMVLRSAFTSSYTISVDHILDGGDLSWLGADTSPRFEGFTSMASISLSGVGSALNAIEVRGVVPSSVTAALERRLESRESVSSSSPSNDSHAADAALAGTAGSEAASRANSTSSATYVAYLASQSDGLREGNSSRTANGLASNGKDQEQRNGPAVRNQDELDELYSVTRRGLKRKLPGDVSEPDETDGDDAEMIKESSDNDATLRIEAGLQFDAAGNTGTQMPELALASLPADGLIDVLAADVNSRAGDVKMLETGRLVLVEPAMMAYQAFEMVIDRNAQAEGRVADALDVATVAMNEQPVVQVQ
jgi:hypothetical protein